MAEKSMVSKLILDASSYQKGIDVAKAATKEINKELELWKTQNKAAGDSAKYLEQQLKTQKQAQQILSDEMTVSLKRYNDIIDKQGEGSKAAISMKTKILDLQIQQAKLNEEIQKGAEPFSNFKNHLTDISNNLKAAGEKMVSAGKNMSTYITAPAIAAGTGILKLASDASEYADTIGVMSEKTGMSLKSLQEMQFVTNQLDMDFETIPNSMTQFTNRLKGVEKDSGDTAKAMKALGVDMQDSAGKTRPISDIYSEIITKLSGMKNESDRNIMASALFGKSWSDLAPMLNAGSVEIEKLKGQAHNLGLVMSDEAVKKARDFGDQMDAVKMQFKVAGAEIGTSFMPVIKDTLIPFIQSSVIPTVQSFAGHITDLINWFKGLNPNVQSTIGIIAGLVVAAGPALVVIGNISKGASALVNGVKAVTGAFGAVKTAIAAFTATTGASALAVVGIVAGVAALAAGAYLLIKNWDTAVPFFQSVWTLIKSAFATGGGAIMVVVREIQLGLAKFLDFTAGNLLSLYSGLFGFLSQIPGIGGAFKTAQEGIDSLRGSLKGFVASSEEDLNEAKSNIGELAGQTKEAWGTMSKAASELGKGMGNTIKESVDKVKGIFKSVPTAAKTVEPDMKQAGKDAGTAYGEGISLGSEDAAKKAKEAAEKAKQEMVANINSLNSAVLAALKRKYDAQKRLDDNALQEETENLEKWKKAQLKTINEVHDRAIAALDAETKTKTEALQAQIDSLDAQLSAEEKAKQEKEELEKISSLQSKLLAESDAAEKESILAELNEAISARNERLHKEEIEAQKEALQKQIEAIQSAAEDKKAQIDAELEAQQESLNTQYENEKENLDKRKQNIDKFYSDIESSASLSAEAQKLIMSKNQQEIAALLKTYGNEYEDSGKTLGERFFDGFKAWADQVSQLIGNAFKGIPGSAGPVQNTQNANVIAVMKANSQAWFAASDAEKKRLADMNKKLGESAGLTRDESGIWHNPDGTRAYAKGTDNAAPGWALVGEEGPELVRFRGGEKVIPNKTVDKLGSEIDYGKLAAAFAVAVKEAFRNKPGNKLEVVVKLKERELARTIIPLIEIEQQRLGMDNA